MKNEEAAGTLQGLQLVVRDIDEARRQLVDGGVDVQRRSSISRTASRSTGPSPDRADYETFLSFSDPDGNGWMIQEVPSRPS